jgi:hypothetical protein
MRLVLLLSLAVLCGCTPRSEIPFLMHVQEAESAAVDQVAMSGSGPRHPPYRLEARRQSDPSGTSVALDVGGWPHFQFLLPDPPYSFVDLTTMKPLFFQSRPDLEFIVELTYGRPRAECFINHDGRDYVHIEFRSNREPVAYPVSFDGCENDVRGQPRSD